MREDLQVRFDFLIGKLSERKKEVMEFIGFLYENTSYFVCPASPKYHMNREEGLLEHSINVAENCLKIKNVLDPSISDESCIICSLFHDLGKAGYPGKPYYLINEPTPNQKKYGYKAYPPYKYNEDCSPYMAVPDRSLYMISNYSSIRLTADEWQAIRIHDGMYVDDNQSYGTKETNLSLILHYADSWSGFVVEKDQIVKFGDNK